MHTPLHTIHPPLPPPHPPPSADVTFYGQGLMNSSVVQSVLAATSASDPPMERLRAALAGSIYVTLIALPGYWAAVALIDVAGRRPLQLGGFALEAATFVALAAAYRTPLRTAGKGAGMIVLYGLTYFFANAGPNTTTFVLPAEAFPTRIRTTAHGISAASGKIGAAVGSYCLLALWYSFCGSSRDGTGAANCALPGSLPDEVDSGIV